MRLKLLDLEQKDLHPIDASNRTSPIGAGDCETSADCWERARGQRVWGRVVELTDRRGVGELDCQHRKSLAVRCCRRCSNTLVDRSLRGIVGAVEQVCAVSARVATAVGDVSEHRIWQRQLASVAKLSRNSVESAREMVRTRPQRAGTFLVSLVC